MTSAVVVSDKLKAALNPLQGLADDIETGGLSPGEVSNVLGLVRQIERQCAGINSAISQCAHQAHHAGQGPPVEEVLGSDNSIPTGQARAESARLSVLGAFPVVRAGLRAGTVFPANVDVLARLIADMTAKEVGALAADDAAIADIASRLSSESFGKHVRRKRDIIRKDHGADAASRARKNATCRVGPNADRTGYFVSAQLDSEDGAVFLDGYQKSLRRVEKELGPDHGLSANELAVRALVDPYLRGANTASTFENTGPAVVLNVLTDHRTIATGPHDHTIAETFDGHTLAPQQLGRLCCDATLRRIDTLPDGTVNVSHSGRTATPAQRAALRARYSGCAISGTPWSQCEIHHVVYFSNCKETAVSNLVPISRRWHHLIHDAGWELELDPDRTIRLYSTDGQLHRTITPPEVHQLAA